MYSRLPRQKYIQKIAKAARISTDLVLSLERCPRIVMLVHEAVDALLAGVSLSSWTSPSTSSSPVQMPSSSFTNTFSFTPTLFDIIPQHKHGSASEHWRTKTEFGTKKSTKQPKNFSICHKLFTASAAIIKTTKHTQSMTAVCTCPHHSNV